MKMIDLESFLNHMQEAQTKKSEPLPEAILERLREFQDRRAATNPFKVGDTIKVRDDSPFKGIDNFLVILEIDNTVPKNPMDSGSVHAYRQDTVYCATIQNDMIITIWLPHEHLEHYAVPGVAASA